MRAFRDLRAINADYSCIVTIPPDDVTPVARSFQSIERVGFNGMSFLAWAILSVTSQKVSFDQLLDRCIDEGVITKDREAAAHTLDMCIAGLIESDLIDAERIAELGMTLHPKTAEVVGAILGKRELEIRAKEAERMRILASETTNAADLKKLEQLKKKLATEAQEKADKKTDEKHADNRPGMPAAAGGK
jgi:hypothetical protein